MNPQDTRKEYYAVLDAAEAVSDLNKLMEEVVKIKKRYNDWWQVDCLRSMREMEHIKDDYSYLISCIETLNCTTDILGNKYIKHDLRRVINAIKNLSTRMPM